MTSELRRLRLTGQRPSNYIADRYRVGYSGAMFPVASPGAQFLDLDALAATPLASEPFPYLIVPGFLGRAALDAIAADFPRIDKPGSFPTSELSFGKRFQTLLDELEGPAMREICAAKFAIDLSQRPTMVTVPGPAQPKDGRIPPATTPNPITVPIS